MVVEYMIYDAERLQILMGNVITFNVYEGDGFYIRFRELYGNFRKVINYNEISYCLDDFGKEGSFFIH